jgi:hypothetical protein
VASSRSHLSLKLNKKIIDAAPQSLYDFGKALGVVHNAPAMVAQALVQKYVNYWSDQTQVAIKFAAK